MERSDLLVRSDPVVRSSALILRSNKTSRLLTKNLRHVPVVKPVYIYNGRQISDI
jgi:hypothetical protein